MKSKIHASCLVILIGLLCLHGPPSSAQAGLGQEIIIEPSAHTPHKAHVLQIGVDLGYLSFASSAEVVLQRIAKDGFRYVRTYEPWVKGRRNSVSSVLDHLTRLIDSGLIPVLSLSNYPISLTPSESRREEIIQTFPQSEGKKIRKANAYTNRFPPDDLNEYWVFLQNFIARVEEAFGKGVIRNWYFEIGNEPDAPLYFWGSPAEFMQILDISRTVIKQQDPMYRVGAAGFTAGLVAQITNRKDYYALAQKISEDPAFDFLSFHIYDDKFTSEMHRKDSVQKFLRRANDKPIILSEWNVSTGMRKANKTIQSPAFMAHLVRTAALCYEQGIDMLFIHKLLDNPRNKKTGQFGLFDRAGAPKAGYEYLMEFKELVESGYVVERTEQAITLDAGDRVAILITEGRNTISFPNFRVVDSSGPFDDARVALGPGEWLVLERR